MNVLSMYLTHIDGFSDVDPNAKTPEGWRTYQPKHCGNNNKDEDNSLKTLNDKNHQASPQKFRQCTHCTLSPTNKTEGKVN